MSFSRKRQPVGTPQGGQFAASTKSDSEISLNLDQGELRGSDGKNRLPSRAMRYALNNTRSAIDFVKRFARDQKRRIDEKRYYKSHIQLGKALGFSSEAHPKRKRYYLDTINGVFDHYNGGERRQDARLYNMTIDSIRRKVIERDAIGQMTRVGRLEENEDAASAAAEAVTKEIIKRLKKASNAEIRLYGDTRRVDGLYRNPQRNLEDMLTFGQTNEWFGDGTRR